MSGDGGAPPGAPPDRAAATVHPAAHVRHVKIGAETVLLDLRGDRYLSVPTDAFEALMAGETVSSAVREHMIGKGLFTVAQAAEEEARPEGLTWARAWQFAASCLWARARTKSRRLDLAIADLASMRVAMCDDADKRAQRLAHFMVLRPWYPRRPVCLFDSLALAHFMLSAGHHVQIVFGVRTQPFAAHAWVEASQTILNDGALYCASFTEVLRAP